VQADEWGKAVQKCNHHTCHIGLYRGRHRSKRSDWRWSDRTPVDYQNWNSYREGRHTGETRSAIFRSDKGWHDWGTGIEQLQPLCEKCHIHETYKPAPKNNPKPKPKPVVAGIVFSTDVKFVGCFKDTASHPGKHGPLKYGYNSETCKQACKKYDYFSLQDWGFCSCFNEKIWPDIVDLQVSDEKCGKVCPCEEKAVPMRRCGEKWLNAVYTTKDITHHMGLSWSYHGKHDGRKTWCSRYNKKLGTGNCCGYEQSPVNVDLRNVSKGNTSDLVTHFAGLQEAEMYHAGHTLALNGKAMWKDAITFEGEKFHLMNITFHQASETSIDGTPYGFEAQMLFKNRRGDGVISEWGDKMVIITTLFQIGKPNPYLKKLKWDQLPKEKCSKVDLGKIDPIGLVPTMKLFTSGAQKKMSKVPEMSYYQYEGSLSIPPCTEGVQWLVLTHPNTISKEQLAQFPLKDNVRKIQPLNGRVIEYLDGAYGSGDVGMQFKGAVESWKSSHTAKMKSKIVDRINHFSPKHHQIDASKVTLKIGAGSIVVNMHVEDVSLQALTKFKNEIKNGLFNPMDGEFKSEVAKMGGFKVKKYIKRKRSKSSLKKAPAPIAIKVKVPPSTEFPTSPPVAPVKLVDPWVLCAHVPHHSVILLSLGGDMKLFTGTTIFLTQLQLHLQDLLRIGPQDLEIFVKPNKVLQVEVTLFNDAAGALAVALVRHWQAGNFHPFQNFPVNVLQVLGSPACTVNNTLVQTAVPTTAQPTEVPTTAAPTTATPTPAPTEGPTQPPVVHVVPKIKVKVPATTAPSAVPSAAPSEGPTQAPVMHAPAGPAPVVVNLKMPAAAQQKPVIASDSTDLQKQLDQLKDSLLKELDVKLRTISQTKGSELLKAELKHYINKKVSLLKAEHVQTHASVAELRASMIESLKVLLKHAIEGFHAGEAVATATKPSVHVTHNIVQPNVHVTNHVTHNVVVTPNVQVTHNIHVTHNIVVKHNAAAAANAAQTVVAHNAAAAARAVHKGAATLAPTATALPTVVPVVQKYHAEADGFKSNIDAMMRLRDRAIKYHSQPMNGRNVHGTSDHKPQFGRPMSTPRKHCSPYDHWNVDSFC
jgi:carbonic anhydrase